MRKLIYALLVVAVNSCTPASASDLDVKDNPDGSATITLTPEQAALCRTQGGCITAPIDLLREAVR